MKKARGRFSRWASLLGLWALVVALARCGGCKQPGSEAPPSASMAQEPVPSEVDFSQMEELPPGIQFGPANIRLRQLAGEMDVKNRYASTVMLSLKDPMDLPDCSGVLLGPRLVLTAASCLCALEGQMSGETRLEARADASSCVKRVFVTMVTYGRVGQPDLLELTTQMTFQTRQGSVKPHPELELLLDEKGRAVGGRADLAVIHLDEPLEAGGGRIALAQDEVREGELLVMAGFGHDPAVGGFHGARYFRKNRTVGVPATGRERFLYEQQGAYAYNGFDGGPCFREEGNRRWLMGVAAVRPGQELECTSLFVYREWVHEEIRRAEGRRGTLQSQP